MPMARIWNTWSLKRFSNPKYSKLWHSPHPVKQPCAASGEVCGHGSLTVGSWAKRGQRIVFTKSLLVRYHNTLSYLNKFMRSFPVELLEDGPRLCRLPCRSPTTTTKSGKCRKSVAAVAAPASAITTSGCCVLSYIFCPETLTLSSVL